MHRLTPLLLVVLVSACGGKKGPANPTSGDGDGGGLNVSLGEGDGGAEPSGEKALRLAMGIIGVLLTSGTNRVDGSLLEPHKRQELKAIASEARGGAE